MAKLYTIGFTQKSAEKFFMLLRENSVDVVLDVRLNNTSQLSGFAKYPDIKFFLESILDVKYINDKEFAPTDYILKRYKKKEILWDDYVSEFNELMNHRKIESYINAHYADCKDITYCLLCSESDYKNCHRSLVAELIKEALDCDLTIVHL